LHHASTTSRKQVHDLLDVAAGVKTATIGGDKSAAKKSDPLAQSYSRAVEMSPTQIKAMKHKAHQFIKQQGLSSSQRNVVHQLLDYFAKVRKHKHKYRCKDLFPSLLHLEGIEPPQLLVTGEPGAGKSYVTDSIRDIAPIMKVGHVASTSYNGMAAVNVDGGTICLTFSIFDTSDAGKVLDDDTVQKLQQLLDSDDLCCLIVDEISTIDAHIIALLSFHLQQIMDNELPFGGLPIVFSGDFSQLGPVKKTFLPKDMMAWASCTYHEKTVVDQQEPLVQNNASPPAAKLSLDQPLLQQPSPPVASPPPLGATSPTSSIPNHVNISASSNSSSTSNRCKPPKPTTSVNFARKFKSCRTNAKAKRQAQKQDKKKMDAQAKKCSPDTLTYHGCSLLAQFKSYKLEEQHRSSDALHNQFVHKLSSGKPIELKDVLHYKPLSTDDIASAPDEWKYAPILVSTNAERLCICRFKAQMWAKEHATYVFKWPVNTRRHINRPNPQSFAAFKENNPFFWQYFVPGVPAYLNNNVNCNLGFVNGSPLTTHSLTFSEESHYNDILQHIEDMKSKGCPIPYGSEIVVPEPLAVNVVIAESLDGKPVSSKWKQQLDQLHVLSRQYNISPHSRDIILPLTTSMAKSSSDGYHFFTYCTNDPLSPIAKAQVKEPFPFELAFSMTIHKAQGHTISRVVVDLTHHPMEVCCMQYAAIFVAMSRVKHSDHLRLLEPTTAQPRSSSYQYLCHLRPDKSIAPFLYGYRDNGLSWDAARALSFSFQNQS
jgi:hypothetical protein